MKFNSQAWQYSYPGFMCDVVTQRGTSMSGDTLMIEPVASSMFFHFFVLRIYHSHPLQKEEDDDVYTDDALLDQDILRYSLVIARDQTPEQIDKNNPKFTHRVVAKWLIKNNSKYKALYKEKDLTDSEKIGNTQRRVKNRLRDLEVLGLLKQHG
ncbi:MAG TPA: hypothetical protein VN922_16630, partial [Bacteroidia bacterium]|nr:hypothetical protein [Bacteroidia bacterium]